MQLFFIFSLNIHLVLIQEIIAVLIRKPPVIQKKLLNFLKYFNFLHFLTRILRGSRRTNWHVSKLLMKLYTNTLVLKEVEALCLKAGNISI